MSESLPPLPALTARASTSWRSSAEDEVFEPDIFLAAAALVGHSLVCRGPHRVEVPSQRAAVSVSYSLLDLCFPLGYPRSIYLCLASSSKRGFKWV